MPKMLKLRELSEETGISYYGLRKLCLEGALAHVRIAGTYYTTEEWFEKYLNQQGAHYNGNRLDQTVQRDQTLSGL
ncbi:MAG: hypothetical protein II918_02470 [Firmicutes bacterium]|nr:hypothetical protein [Bacillota bacterium]